MLQIPDKCSCSVEIGISVETGSSSDGKIEESVRRDVEARSVAKPASSCLAPTILHREFFGFSVSGSAGWYQ
jgi:hypothetical protein